MAYGNYYPATYQPALYGQPNPYFQQMQNQAMMQQNQQLQGTQMSLANQQNQQTTIQQSGFVLVQSEQEARAYPVAPGNSVTFKDESQPYCYVKTMGFNQLDRPLFEKYRLVKEEDGQNIAKNPPKTDFQPQDYNLSDFALKSDLDAVFGEIEALKKKINALTDKKPEKSRLVSEGNNE